MRRREGKEEEGRKRGAHCTEVSEVSNFPSEAPLISNGYPVLPLPSRRSIHGLPRICVHSQPS